MPKRKEEAKEKPQKGGNPSYGAKDIYVLEGLEPVRKRPGMYIGSTGADGLHHLIWEVTDNSLTYETPVLVERDGMVRLEKIGEAIDEAIARAPGAAEISGAEGSKRRMEILREGFRMRALSFDPKTLRMQWKPVSSLIRHAVNSDIYEITLQNNRKVRITPYHSLFTLREGEVVPVRGSDLAVGSAVIVPNAFPEPECAVAEINLHEELLKLDARETAPIMVRGVRELLANDTKPCIKRFFETQGKPPKPGRTWSNIFHDFKRYDYLPFNALREMPVALRERFRDCRLSNRRNDGFSLPAALPITRDLIELLGLYAAEGTTLASATTHRVVWSFGSREHTLIAHARTLIERVFGYSALPHYAHESATTIQIDSLFVSLLFSRVFRAGRNSKEKRVPDIVWNVSPCLRTRYLFAYLAGDGYPSSAFTEWLIQGTAPGEEERRKFTAVSASRDLMDGLSYLLFSLGKTFSVGARKGASGHRISLSYHGKKREMTCESGPSWSVDFYWGASSSYADRVPVRDICRSISWKRPYSFSLDTNGGVTRAKAATLVREERMTLYPHAEQFLSSELGVVKVVKIEQVAYDRPWVYDFSVPDGENFVGGHAPIAVHNSIDEAMAGHAKNITIELLPDNLVAVTDDGRGIPVEMHHQTKKSALETVLTTLHAGGKFGGESYKVSGGLHGVGVSVVNALSKYLRVEVCRDGGLYMQEYERGNPKAKVKKIGSSGAHGTKVVFSPDPQIFTTAIEFNEKRILDHLRQQAYLTKGVRMNVIDRRSSPPKFHGFYFEGGLRSFVKFLSRDEKPLQEEIFHVQKEHQSLEVEAAFLYVEDIETRELSFANNIYTPDGGMHLTGFKSALTRSMNTYARAEGYLKEKDENLTSDDTREGLIAVLSVRLREPQFEGQTKARLGNPEARTAVEAVMNDALKEFLEKRPQEARRMVEKVLLAAKARMAAKAAKDTVLRKGALEGLTLPGKLADCSSKNAEESELFLVEGDSAGGTAKSGRDRRTQAILPVKGKILNVEKARIDKMLANQEIRSLVIALGTAISDNFDLSKIRYHKIVLMSDADVDGAHIRTLFLTLFYRYFPQIIEAGYLYIAQPPLFRVQMGKQVRYVYDEAAKDATIKELQREKQEKTAAKKGKKGDEEDAPEGGELSSAEAMEGESRIPGIAIQRYKGLGEMNAEQLWSTTMNPETRILKQVEVDDAAEADRLFNILMGDNVEPRKQFIQAHAATVQNLDV